MKLSSRKISVLSLLIAVSVVGAYLKIPSPLGSIALDSFPSLIAGAFLGGFLGGLVAFFGHFLSALLAGFPLGPFHLLIAIEMFVLVLLFTQIYHSGRRFLGYLFFIVGNGVILPIPFFFLLGSGYYFSILPFLCVAASVNGVIGALLLPRLERLGWL